MKQAQISFYEQEMLIEDINVFIKLPYQEILYLEYSSPYIFIFQYNGEKYCITQSLSAITRELPYSFALANRSVVVNLNYFECIQKENSKAWLKLKTGFRIPVSRRKIETIRDKVLKVSTIDFCCEKCIGCKNLGKECSLNQ